MAFRRALTCFDATMVVVGGIIGAGIFINPYLVAQRLPSAGLSFPAATPRLECIPPHATLAFPRLRGSSDSLAFTERLFRETGTAVAPGHFFGAPAHFRMSLGGLPSKVAAGLESIARCLDGA